MPSVITTFPPTTPRTKPSPPPRLSTPTSTTAPLTTFSTQSRSCYLCDEQNPGDFSPTTKFLDLCQLCSRDFCPIHKDASHESVCSINHSRYYHERLELARKQVAQRGGRDGVWDENEAEEIVAGEGIYPSVGEREKMVWSSTPVSEEKMREIANFRLMTAEMRGMKDQQSSSLIETKEFIGADIAV